MDPHQNLDQESQPDSPAHEIGPLSKDRREFSAASVHVIRSVGHAAG
jgi:hypothetical protein